MPKKRLSTNDVFRPEDDASCSSTSSIGPPSKRRRKTTSVPYDAQEVCQELYETIRNHKTEDGRVLCESFIRAPKRRTDPEYYNTVTQPMDMLKVQSKLRAEEYSDVDQLATDLELIINNAKAYYQPTSAEYQDACELWDLFTETKSVLLSEVLGNTMDPSLALPLKLGLDVAEQRQEEDGGVESEVEEEDDEDALEEDEEMTSGPAAANSTPVAEVKEAGAFSKCKVPPAVTSQGHVTVHALPEQCVVNSTQPVQSAQPQTSGITGPTKVPLGVSNYPQYAPYNRGYPYSMSFNPNRPPAEFKTPVIPARQAILQALSQKVRSHKINSQGNTISGNATGQELPAVPAPHVSQQETNVAHDLVKGPNPGKVQAEVRVHDGDEVNRCQSLKVRLEKIDEEAYLCSEGQDVWASQSQQPATASTLQIENAMAKEEGSREDEDESVYEELFQSVVMAKDGNRPISQIFKVLPSREAFPDYYEVIKDPIDLRTIARKLRSGVYSTLDDLTKDFYLMVQNARTFNEPGSQIYKDASTMKKLIQAKRAELDQPRPVAKLVRSERIRSRKSGGQYQTSAMIASLPSPDPVEDESVVGDGTESVGYGDGEEGVESGLEGSVLGDRDEDDPMVLVYNAVAQNRNCLGQKTSDPFLRLPSKRIYPDYYEEIKKPMSLLKVQKKLKNDRYRDLTSMVRDVNLIFENAKHYNVEESKIYKDAVKLQGILQLKVEEVTKAKEQFWDSATEISLRPPGMSSASKRRNMETSSTTSEDSAVRDSGGKKKPGRKSMTAAVAISPEEALRKRLWGIYKTVADHHVDLRPLIDIFMTLPSKRDYPDYYTVISEPIDMTMIESKIKGGTFINEQALVSDLELMFNNARLYNEEESQVYKDACTLERVLMCKIRSMPGLTGNSDCSPRKAKTLMMKLQEMYNAIRDHSDIKKRVLSTPFMKLPNKTELPDYYEVIKKPMDMQKVFQRMINTQYSSVEDMTSDFVLMFDNACRYNEPDSLIYKDALTLQRVCLEKKQELCANDEDSHTSAPDVKSAVHELMKNLFISTYSHTDEEGRCYCDSFQELPTKMPAGLGETEGSEDADKPVKMAPSFEQVKSNLDKGRYRRMDRFQDDMFEVFEYARKVSRMDSQVYEDSVELQLFFMRVRDELCRNGDVLLTPALSYTELHLQKTLENERKQRSSKEREMQRDDEEKKKEPSRDGQEEGGEKKDDQDVKMDDASSVGPGDSEEVMEFDNETYYCGDFVYVEPLREKASEPHIVHIEKFEEGENGEARIKGCWFLRPNETYHLATRKFLQKEVFKSDFNESVPMSKILGKCFVMFVKDYYKLRPEGFADKDVYVCESRYNARHKAFKKIKLWVNLIPKHEHVELVAREQVLMPVRVASVFAELNTKEGFVDDGQTQILDKEREMVEVELATEDGVVHYEQIQAPSCWIKLGDCVYLTSDIPDQPHIAKVERIWKDQSGETYIHGPYFLHPASTEHAPTRLFYEHEVFRSSMTATCSLAAVLGRCAVLTHREFSTSRPTEISEVDVYLCESKYNDADRVIAKFNKPPKKVVLSVTVCDDEVYYFKRAITPNKEPSPLLPRTDECATGDDNPSVVEVVANTGQQPSEVETPAPPEPTTEKKKKVQVKKKLRQVSGYIVYAAECRKDIQNEYKEMSFGEISRIVGSKWKALPRELKENYEGKARKIMSDQAKQEAEADKALSESLAASPATSSAQTSRSGTPATTSGVTGSAAGQSNQQSAPPPPPPRPASPVFVSVPPRTQRVLHSEAYLRYIEGLNPNDTGSIGGWEKSLYATPDNTPLADAGKLPVHWLAHGSDHHNNTVDALWALRDLMMKDALCISRTLDFSQI